MYKLKDFINVPCADFAELFCPVPRLYLCMICALDYRARVLVMSSLQIKLKDDMIDEDNSEEASSKIVLPFLAQ